MEISSDKDICESADPDIVEVMNPMNESPTLEKAETGNQKQIFTKLSDIEKVWNDKERNVVLRVVHCVVIFFRSEEVLIFDLLLSVGVCIFNLCTITKHSPPIFNTLSTFAVCFTSYLAFQYCSLRFRNGRVVPTLVLIVRNWNHLCQLIVVIILTECLRSGNDEIRDDYKAADGHTVHRYYHCTDLYYGLNYLKSAYHFLLICYVILYGEITIYNFFSYTGKYFFKTFYFNRCRKAAVNAAVGRDTLGEP